MSERMTAVGPRERIPGVSGPARIGRKSRAEMLADFRRYHETRAETARIALALTDDELIVETYLGLYAQRGKTEVTE